MKGKTMWNEAMGVLEKRMLFHDEIAPGLLISAGAHLANLRQRHDPFYLPGGVPEDCRLSAVLVAPSGFSKSFSMKQFMDPSMGFLPFPSAFRGKITEAGFIGTINSEGEVVHGDAHRFRDGIIGFHEVTHLFSAAAQEHSAGMLDQIMDCLSEGRVSKTLAAGPIQYPSHVTIWGGVQPKRFDFSAGLARRFLFIAKRWEYHDRRMLMERMIPSGKKDLDEYRETQAWVKDLRERIKVLQSNFKPTLVTMDEKLETWMLENASNHIQMSLMMRALIGYETMQLDESGTDSDMKLRYNEDTQKILAMIVEMDDLVSEGADISLLVTELEKRGEATQKELWDIFKAYSYSYSDFHRLLSDCTERLRMVQRDLKDGNIVFKLRYKRKNSKGKRKVHISDDRIYA